MKEDTLIFAKIGFILCALSVLFNAVGTHLLKEFIGTENIDEYISGTNILFFHALVLIVFSLSSRKFNIVRLQQAFFLFLVGILFYTGGIFIRAIWVVETNRLWVLTIVSMFIGGIAYIGGWILLFFAGLKEDEDALTKKKKSHHRSHRKSNSEAADSTLKAESKE